MLYFIIAFSCLVNPLGAFPTGHYYVWGPSTEVSFLFAITTLSVRYESVLRREGFISRCFVAV